MPRQGIVVCILIAVVGFPYGSYQLLDYLRFASRAQETQGLIVARDSANFTIQFAVDGQAYQIQEALPSTRGMAGQARMALQPGTAVRVLYDPSSPQSAKWKASRNWVFPVAVLLVSAIAALTARFPEFMSRPLR